MLWRDSHTSFWLCLFLGCLMYMLLNHMFVANARLLFLSMFACNCCVFLLILGKWWSYFVHLYPNKNISIVHKSWGASLFSLEHSFTQIEYSFILLAHRIFWLLASLCVMQMRSICAMCFVSCALLLWLGSSCIIVDSLVDIMFLSIATFLFVYTSFFVDTYHDYYRPLRNFYTWKSSYLRIWLHSIDFELL